MAGWRGEPPPFFPSASHTAKDRIKLSEIIAGKLYVSNFKGAEDTAALRAVGVTHICAVGDEFAGESGMSGFKYWRHDITDDAHQGAVMSAALRDGAKFIAKAVKKKKGCVLVHCAAGISRSATVVLGFYLLHRDECLRDAFAHLFRCRPCIWPNEGFMATLITLEREVRGSSSMVTLTLTLTRSRNLTLIHTLTLRCEAAHRWISRSTSTGASTKDHSSRSCVLPACFRGSCAMRPASRARTVSWPSWKPWRAARIALRSSCSKQPGTGSTGVGMTRRTAP